LTIPKRGFRQVRIREFGNDCVKCGGGLLLVFQKIAVNNALTILRFGLLLFPTLFDQNFEKKSHLIFRKNSSRF